MHEVTTCLTQPCMKHPFGHVHTVFSLYTVFHEIIIVTYARIRTVRTPAQTRKQMQLTVAIFALILHFETIGTH